jgi:hypothetical protein
MGGGGSGDANQWQIQSRPGANDTHIDREEGRIRAQAMGDLAQAKEIDNQVKMLRDQLKWDRQEMAFLNGVGPAPTTNSPRTNTQGAAGNVGSAPAAGATSGANAQRFQNLPNNQSTSQYLQFLQQDVKKLNAQIHSLENEAEGLRDRAHALLASIRGKSDVPDIVIDAGTLLSLINEYNNI